MPRYKVEITMIEETYSTTTIEVEADNKEDAKEDALEKANTDDNIFWDFSNSETIDFEVTSVTRIPESIPNG